MPNEDLAGAKSLSSRAPLGMCYIGFSGRFMRMSWLCQLIWRFAAPIVACLMGCSGTRATLKQRNIVLESKKMEEDSSPSIDGEVSGVNAGRSIAIRFPGCSQLS